MTGSGKHHRCSVLVLLAKALWRWAIRFSPTSLLLSRIIATKRPFQLTSRNNNCRPGQGLGNPREYPH